VNIINEFLFIGILHFHLGLKSILRSVLLS
jgi:hypothetical protein